MDSINNLLGSKIFTREMTRRVYVGSVAIGGGAPISIQSMTRTRTEDVEATVQQIKELKEAGCDIVRLAIPNERAAKAIGEIKRQVDVPIVADIHFSASLALKAIESGADKVRLNPGNIRNRNKLVDVVRAASERSIPIRIGVNAGSLHPELLRKYGGPTPEAMVESAALEIAEFERLGFHEIVVSLKSSDVMDTISAYIAFASRFAYPLHVGVTEAGFGEEGIVASAIGIGTLLSLGIGDTIRVSLPGDPKKEVKVAHMILRMLRLRYSGVRIIACPMCGRHEIDVKEFAERVGEVTGQIDAPLTIAVMGCHVNGPGEARMADLGIAPSRDKVALFVRGEVIKVVPKERALEELTSLAMKIAGQLENNGQLNAHGRNKLAGGDGL
ncbi:MAG: flavodoxin-dependent (E)-4-hydroxy-3-methylbut-2-enyl-diphosphate synthase [Armatimonadota bacterium]|nr:flavodoxin-dependent (E)-4-hydroxy-3-methylbut-2-enyl-diphosphate synthase [Armatimonadota bacterium]MDW8026006.1 flavodoxin-dependent (E)-4-hydroxy-3-methylbut-2-enyl-diphosphate synthase [Armatimonadota bacterium]